jgi:hypothetical protein
VGIFSAKEDEKVAKAIQENIGDSAETAVWTQDTFVPSETTLKVLAKSARSYDFAIFVFSPIDRVTMRAQSHFVPRDNVVFEAGLFMGRLGQERVFLLEPSTHSMNLSLPFRILSDLHGFIRVKYDPSQANLVAALGPACSQIERVIERLGARRQRVQILNKKSGKCLDVEGWESPDGIPIIQYKFHGSDNQLWMLFSAKEGHFKFMAKHSGKFLDIRKGYIHQQSEDADARQEWLLEQLGDGSFKIQNQESRMFLTVAGGSLDDGAKIVQQNWRADDSFHWWVTATVDIP